MDGNITELFDILIKQYPDLESAKEAFQEYMKENPDMEDDYKEWCDTMGYSEKKGFSEYYVEYMEHADSIWDSIYPNQEDGDDFHKE